MSVVCVFCTLWVLHTRASPLTSTIDIRTSLIHHTIPSHTFHLPSILRCGDCHRLVTAIGRSHGTAFSSLHVLLLNRLHLWHCIFIQVLSALLQLLPFTCLRHCLSCDSLWTPGTHIWVTGQSYQPMKHPKIPPEVEFLYPESFYNFLYPIFFPNV